MIRVDLDVMMARRKMSLTELSQKVGITMANLSILKNGHANDHDDSSVKQPVQRLFHVFGLLQGTRNTPAGGLFFSRQSGVFSWLYVRLRRIPHK